jgi:hypothetical protein
MCAVVGDVNNLQEHSYNRDARMVKAYYDTMHKLCVEGGVVMILVMFL